MADANKNLGAQVQVGVYVEGKRVGRDFTDILDFHHEDQYYEGDDEYQGPGDVRHWQRYKNTIGSFTLHENNASYIDLLFNAINVATIAGQQPKIVLAKITTNTDGTTSRISWRSVTLKRKFDSNSKGEKVVNGCSWTGIANTPE